MAQTVKQKIRLGTVFLFGLLLLTAGVGMFHIIRLKNDADQILQNNYESIEYVHAMSGILDSLPLDSATAFRRFEAALSLQQRNITEPDEKEATEKLMMHFKLWREGNNTKEIELNIRKALNEILILNMNAIQQKNERASATADKAMTYITLIAGLVFVVGVSFVYNFPSILTGPINAFTSGIEQISHRNYSHRIRLTQHDEFGQMATSFNDMAERLEYFENSNLNTIIFEKNRAEAVINSLKDASIGIDKNNTVLFVNDQALRLLNLQSTDMVSKKIEEISEHNDLLRFLIEENGSVPFKIVVDNRENYFIKEVIDITQEEGPGNKMIVLKNITSFKELDVAKTNFIATISHELKTPLASSDLSLRLLDDDRIGTLTAEQKDLIAHLKGDNQRMLRILSELLNMAQVEAGKIQLDVQDVSPYTIADTAIESFATTAKEKNVLITKKYDQGLPTIKADAEKTGWVMSNFLTNAIKHSGDGSEIVVSIVNEGNHITFSVTDHGPGVPAEYQSKVFERFFRVPGSSTRGTGLGLAISKEFIEAQAGRIWVSSEVGRGSEFGFSIGKNPLI
ncbi:HAMP domain-containing sensor histidine kinase [Flavitalea sp.]|nr:ATP-binding protein [Flavitalea sp.]